MAWKCVFIFGQSKWGWTETLYWDNLGAGYADAFTAATNLIALRKNMLGAQSSCEAIRFSDTANPQSSVLVKLGGAGGPGSTLESAPPWNCALFDVYAGQLAGVQYKRQYYLRGLPKAWYTFQATNPLTPYLDPNFVSAYTAWASMITANLNSPAGKWVIWASDRSNSTNPKLPISFISLVPAKNNFKLLVRWGTTTPFVQGTRVHVGKVRGPGTRGINRDANVIDYDTTTQALTLSTKQQCYVADIEPTNLGVIYKKSMGPIPIRTVAFDRFVKRSTGKAFFTTAGQSKKGGRC